MTARARTPAPVPIDPPALRRSSAMDLDRRLAHIHTAENAATARIGIATRAICAHAGSVQSGRLAARDARTPFATRRALDRALAELDSRTAEWERLRSDAAHIDRAFCERGGWNRFWRGRDHRLHRDELCRLAGGAVLAYRWSDHDDEQVADPMPLCAACVHPPHPLAVGY